MTALRPLYLDCGTTAVRLEGPALIVDQPDAAEGRFPLRLLSHVAVSYTHLTLPTILLV